MIRGGGPDTDRMSRVSMGASAGWRGSCPSGATQHPADYAEDAFAGVPEKTVEKVLFDTAARLYGVQ